MRRFWNLSLYQETLGVYLSNNIRTKAKITNEAVSGMNVTGGRAGSGNGANLSGLSWP